jgi:hypothetical protein
VYLAWQANRIADQQAELLDRQVVQAREPAVNVRLGGGADPAWISGGREGLVVYSVGAPVAGVEVSFETWLPVCVTTQATEVEPAGGAGPVASPRSVELWNVPRREPADGDCGYMRLAGYFDAPTYTNLGVGELARLAPSRSVPDGNRQAVDRLRQELASVPLGDGGVLVPGHVLVQVTVSYSDLNGKEDRDYYHNASGALSLEEDRSALTPHFVVIADAAHPDGGCCRYVRGGTVATGPNGRTAYFIDHVPIALSALTAQTVLDWWQLVSSMFGLRMNGDAPAPSTISSATPVVTP